MNATRICPVEGCETPQACKGLCNKHYRRLLKHGHVEPTRIQGDDKARLLSRVNKTETCWIWTGSRNSEGYGSIRMGRRGKKAHRVAYELFVGPIPDGHHLDHVCRNTGCVRPDHLRPATPKQNNENRGPNRNGQGFRGVTAQDGRFRACVKHNHKKYSLGMYDTPEEAAEVARLKRLELYTHNDVDRI